MFLLDLFERREVTEMWASGLWSAIPTEVSPECSHNDVQINTTIIHMVYTKIRSVCEEEGN